jgi:RNA polymerase sigma factor (sigma-70 family)
MKSVRTDEQLIEQFVTGTRDTREKAFEILVKRHGPMVMGVCRQVLDRHQDAEDAFQTTFLALARKAGAIQNRRLLGPWLYEVAHRTALRTRVRVSRHRCFGLGTDEREASDAGPEIKAGHSELRLHLGAEVDALPESYRFLVVQCYLQGKTNQEVARLLGRRVGTIKARLSRAREMLRVRLNGTGLDLNHVADRAGDARRA